VAAVAVVPVPTRQDALRIEGEWHEAMSRGDRDALRATMADDFLGADATGERNRDEQVEALLTRAQRPDGRTHLQQHASRRTAGVLIVVGEMYRTVTPSPDRLDLLYYHNVWLWSGERWLLASTTTWQ
jgi:hypothetical protein